MSAEKIEAAVKKLVARVGRANVTRRMLAEEAKVSEPSVSYHAGGGSDALKKYVTKHSKGVVEPSKEKLAKITEALHNERKPGPKAGSKPKVVPMKKSKIKKVAKSSITGKIVSKSHAKANPKTTFVATVKKAKPVAKGERKAKPVAKGEAVTKAQAKAVRVPLPPPPIPAAE